MWRVGFIFLLCLNSIAVSANDEIIFDWAEENFSEFFSPAEVETQTTDGYIYRFYSDTNIFLGTLDNTVYVFGDVFGGLLAVASTDEILALINAENASPAGFAPLVTLEVSNDQPVSRQGELAFSSVPLPQAQNIPSTQQLVVMNAANQVVPAQFNVVSRWGGVMDNAALPIRWLEVSMVEDIAPISSNTYTLGLLDNPPTVENAVTINAMDNNHVVDTGAATFTLDPQSPALLSDIQLSDGTQVFTADSNAGPRLVLADNSTPNPVVDNDGFSIVQSGPVKVVVALKGRFVGNGTMCDTFNAGSYESQGFTLIATFTRGQSYVDLQFQYRNECSDLQGMPWTDNAIQVNQVSYELPVTLSGNVQTVYGGSQSMQAASSSSLKVEQQHGSGTPWQRSAQVLIDDNAIETGTSFETPIAGLVGNNVAVTGQLAWMRFREPQAIAVENNTLSLQFISQPLTVGEARGIWNFARINIASNTDLTAQEALRQQTKAALERGLLVRTAKSDFNAAQIFASLGTDQPSAVKTAYLDMMTMLHNDTLNRQFPDNRTYGSQLWPDIQFDQFPIADPENSTPSTNTVVVNYWNPTRNELLEFLRAGNPLWVWDFAMPQTWQQFFSAYGNIGEYEHGNRNGFALISGGCGRADGCLESNDLGADNLGHWNRSNFGSDDYTYTHGDIAYALRPNYALMRRFAQAGKTVMNRYGDFREQFVSERGIERQVIQHFVLLANCAEFVGGAEGQACHDHLVNIMQEFSNENFANGYLCAQDNPTAADCRSPQQFMANSLMYPFFHRMYLNYGDTMGNNLRR
ncbi:MAG: hypothetical protein AAF512_15475, partial [Pseudomonadota bacterium]